MATVVFDGDVTGPDAPAVQEPEKDTATPEENPATETPAEEPDKKPDQPEKDEKDDDKQDEEVLLEIAGLDMSELSKEYTETGGLSDESYAELAENGFPREVVDAYIRGVTASEQEATAFAEKEIAEIMGIAGGEEGYGKLMTWADGSLSAEEKEAFNKAVTGTDKYIAALAVGGLVARHEQEYGHDPELVGGSRTPAQSVDKFENRAEMVAAMADKRYRNDPDYAAEVERKVLNSGLMRRR